MTIQLLDYKGRKFPVEVPDNTQELHIKIISGDMVLLEPIYFDTGKGSRLMMENILLKEKTLIK